MKFLSLFAVLSASVGFTVAFAPTATTKVKVTKQRAAVTHSTTNAKVVVSTNMVAALDEEQQQSSPLPSPPPLYIDETRRFVMNLILAGSGALTVGTIGVPYIAFFVPPSTGSGSGGSPAKDAIGNDIFAQAYIEEKGPNDRSLVQGLKGDATYLIVKDDKTFESYALNAICTHLGCVVPWSAANNKFICPCHGSQYSTDGSVIRGPAPLPLALAHCDIDGEDGKVMLSPWTEDDFRIGGKGWWN